MNRLPFLLHLVKDNQRYFFHTISPWLVWWLSLLWFGFVHPFLFLVLQQRQKTNHTSPSTSPGILLTTLSPRGQQSKILSSVLFHLRCPTWHFSILQILFIPIQCLFVCWSGKLVLIPWKPHHYWTHKDIQSNIWKHSHFPLKVESWNEDNWGNHATVTFTFC